MLHVLINGLCFNDVVLPGANEGVKLLSPRLQISKYPRRLNGHSAQYKVIYPFLNFP